MAAVRRYPQAVIDKVAVLRGVPLFADLDERSLQAVAVLAREQTHKAGTVLMLEGEPGDEFYVIVDGTIRIEHGDRTVRSMTAGRLPRRDRPARAASAERDRDRRIRRHPARCSSQHEFDRLLETMPAVHRRVRAAIDRRERGERGAGAGEP